MLLDTTFLPVLASNRDVEGKSMMKEVSRCSEVLTSAFLDNSTSVSFSLLRDLVKPLMPSPASLYPTRLNAKVSITLLCGSYDGHDDWQHFHGHPPCRGLIA